MLLVPFFCLPEHQHKIWSRNHLPTTRQRPIGFQICCVRRLSHQQLSPIRLLKGEKQVPTYYLFESPYKILVIHLFLRFTTILLGTEQRGEENWPFKRQTLHLGVYIFFPTHPNDQELETTVTGPSCYTEVSDCWVGFCFPTGLPLLVLFSARKYQSLFFSASHPLRPSSSTISTVKLSQVLSVITNCCFFCASKVHS